MHAETTIATHVVRRLHAAGLRPTRQRILLGHLLFGEGCDRHVTAEQLLRECKESRVHISLATIYNTLHQFTAAGLLREATVDSSRTYFDTNTQPHHHFYCETTGYIQDIPAASIQVLGLPPAPEGCDASHVEIVVRLQPRPSHNA